MIFTKHCISVAYKNRKRVNEIRFYPFFTRFLPDFIKQAL